MYIAVWGNGECGCGGGMCVRTITATSFGDWLHVVVVDKWLIYNQTAQYCCLCRDGGGCLYAVIQLYSRASYS